jgi:6-pyruvoyl-tetrahydropterin synthase
MDFKILKGIIEHYIKKQFDHGMINDALPGKFLPATVENMLQYLWIDSELGKEIHRRTRGDVWLSSIKMWETDDSFGEVSDDRWRNYE